MTTRGLEIARVRAGSLRRSVLLGFVAFAFALAFLSIAGQVAYADELVSSDSGTQQEIVHVGFFKFNGYHNMDSAGEKSGYGYDFLQMISGYANFKYIYVGYQKSWSDMLDMLDSGEIDMLTYGVKTPGLQERFDFSSHSIGTSAVLLTTSVNNAAFADHDYAPFSGMRIGMIQGENRQSAVDAYAAEKGITYTPVYFSDIDAMQAALQSGENIDAMAADELRVLSNEVIVDKFDTEDLYVMVKKGNTKLLDTIDEAIRRLDEANPGWSVDLTNKYFSSEYSAGLPVTLSESEYIKTLTAEGKTLKVLFNPARYPLSYYSDGQVTGALVDIFKGIAAEYGLPYEFVNVGSVDEYYQLRKNGSADIILDYAESRDEAEILGYRVTAPYATSNYSIVTANDFTGTASTVAVINGSSTFYDIAKAYNSKAKIAYYDDFDSCIEAVRAGRVDATFTYSITAQMFVIEDNENKIKATQLNDLTFQFRLAVNSKANMQLYGLLNKATRNLSNSETEETFNSYLLDAKRNYTLMDYLANNPGLAISIIGLVIATLVGFLVVQKRNATKLKASNDALSESRNALEDALELANDANAAKTRFLSQMSHDIRTPLNGIIGMTQIAGENTDDPERVKDALDKISYSSDHLMTLINDILDLSRIESGKMRMAHDPTDIRTTINQCAEVLRGSVMNRDIEVTTDFAPIEQPFVLTDALHVRQILINIISNAVKFTPDGGRIDFRVACTPDADGKRLRGRFEIADTGIGMSEEFLDNIYEAFVQADEFSARTQYKGSGLGMSIVKQFVDMLGGTIDITSKLGVGTTVTVELPFDIDPDAAAASEADAGAHVDIQHDFTGTRVLLVEDNDINMEIAQIMLEERGLVVDKAEDGAIAVAKFEASDPGWYGCIFMDIMMPNMNGYEATKAIRNLNRPDAKTVPIIAMTANAFAEDVKMALDAGMNAHLAKPVNVRSLMETLAKVLHR